MITRVARTFILVLSLVAMGSLVGCGDKVTKAENATKDKEAKFLGEYKNSKEGGTLVLQAEHKGTLDMAGSKGDITWEVAGDDKIIVHAGIPISMFQNADGTLRDEEGTVWKKK